MVCLQDYFNFPSSLDILNASIPRIIPKHITPTPPVRTIVRHNGVAADGNGRSLEFTNTWPDAIYDPPKIITADEVNKHGTQGGFSLSLFLLFVGGLNISNMLDISYLSKVLNLEVKNPRFKRRDWKNNIYANFVFL
jgi:hypothetical protein